MVLWLTTGCIHPGRDPEASALLPAGLARVDITPPHAVPLMGYAARAQLAAPTNAAQRIHARALALGGGTDAAVLLTVDNCILPGALTEQLRSRLRQRVGLAPERVAVLVTHTHSAPCLTGAAPNIFGRAIPPADQAAIDAYTGFFVDRLEQAAVQALADRRPARVARGLGSVDFARNRRTPGGPVDHDLPVLTVRSADGSLRGVFVSYACHCTTLGGEFNAVHGDWAGVAALEMEARHPGCVALVGIGCGADANPDPRGSLDWVNRHGNRLAEAAAPVIAANLHPVRSAPTCRLERLDLPYQPHFTREQWEARAQQPGIVGYHARKWLSRLDQGQPPGPALRYPVQTWAFGRDLAMVFLGGEVVVDYSLRLKRELDAARLWVNAYANDVPCYIPSRRILREGGYEAESSLWYYDRPQQLAPEVEDLVVAAVHRQLGPHFAAGSAEGARRESEPPPATSTVSSREEPPSPEQARQAIQVAPGLMIDLAAAEPLVQSPVAIDFGADGRLWVAEMADYPEGIDGQGRPGGRVKVLTDLDRDGRYDMAEVLADDLPFPTGLMAWRDGVLVCAAPDVWWIRPARGERSKRGIERPGVNSRPAERTRLLTGFATHNFQARVNGLRWGLDGWVYGSGGLFGGRVQVVRTGREIDVTHRDFRWRPDTDELEALNGVSQQGRVRDDFGRWFGNDNSTLLWHFLPPTSARWRNPHQLPPDPRVFVNADTPRVYPASPTLLRFNDPHTANHLTSACAPEIYRDDWLGTALSGNALVCEPVHNLVRRAVLEPEGASFRARRAAGEETREFLASTDSWFRPVEVRTGPDGALWVVDFCRYVIEHPRWIPPDRLRDLVVRAGADRGRIWRVRPADRPPRPVEDLTRRDPRRLVEALDSPNGVVRDLADRELRQRLGGRRDAAVMDRLQALGRSSARPGVRAQALSLVAALGDAAEQERALGAGIRDADPGVRRLALELMPGAMAAREPLAGAVLEALGDSDAGVRFEALLAAGQISPATRVVARLGEQWEGRMKDEGWRMALTGILPGVLPDLVEWLVADPGRWAASGPWWEPILATAVQGGDTRSVEGLARFLARPDVPTRAGLLFLAAWERRPAGIWNSAAATPDAPASRAVLLAALEQRVAPGALRLLADGQAPGEERLAALDWLGEIARRDSVRRRDLVGLLDALPEGRLRQAAWAAVRRQTDPGLAAELLRDWSRFSPARRRETLEALLARPEWTVAVLQAGIDGQLAAGDFSLEQRERLRNHAEPGIRERAARMFPGDRLARAAVLRRHAGVAGLAGRAERGAEHFDRRCASCHAVRGRGHAVGPDLTYFRAKPAGDYLVAILDPSAAIEPRYVGYQVRRRDGRELTGVIRSETAEGFQLVQPGGGVEMLRRDEVASLQAGERSLMPEGLEEGLGDQELADLIAWIRQVPAPFGQAAEGQVRDARRAFRSDQPTPLLRLECTGEVLEYPGWLGRLPLHACRQTDGASRVTWQARVPSAGPTGRHRFRFPAAMGFLSQPSGRFTLHVHGRASLDFDVTLEDREWVGPGEKLRLRYTVQERNGEDGCGLLEIDAGPGWLTEGETIWLEVVGTASQSQRWFGLYRVPPTD